jgi:hypothetical protein
MSFATGVLAVVVVVLPALASGQSLGDVAKKEQERREKLRRAGAATKTLTEEDLATTKGTLANDPNAPAAGDDAGASNAAAPSEAEGSAGGEDRQGASASGEDYWRGRLAQARARLRTAQGRHDFMQQVIRRGQPVMLDENGRRVIYSNQQLKAKADQAQAELAAAQGAMESLLDEARRKGALPGWLR